jgi:hypothetical protein
MLLIHLQTIVEFEARYPLLGGWKADFKLGTCGSSVMLSVLVGLHTSGVLDMSQGTGHDNVSFHSRLQHCNNIRWMARVDGLLVFGPAGRHCALKQGLT